MKDYWVTFIYPNTFHETHRETYRFSADDRAHALEQASHYFHDDYWKAEVEISRAPVTRTTVRTIH